MIFEVIGTPVKIIGSIHFLPDDNTEIASEYFEAVRNADEVFFESNLDNNKLPPIAFYDSFRLPKVITKNAFRILEKRWRELDIKYTLKNMKPWAAGMLINIVGQLKSGASIVGVDRQLWDYALSLDKKPLLLEGAEIFQMMDNAPISEAISHLDFELSTIPEVGARFSRMAKAWRDGNCSAADPAFEEIRRISPTVYQGIFAVRNIAWLPFIEREIRASKKTLFIVGFAHLKHGDQSLEKLLTSKGYTLRQISP